MNDDKKNINFERFVDDLHKEIFMKKISEIDDRTRLCESCKKKIIDGYYDD